MAVIFCPHCRKSISAPANAVGRKATCPHCRKGFVIGGTVAKPAAVRGGWRLTWVITGAAVALGLAVAIFVGKLFLGDTEPNIVPAQPGKNVVTIIDAPKKEPKTDAKKADPAPEPAKEIPQAAEPLDEQFANLIARLNSLRKAAKLPPVSLDAELSTACQAHADYVATNREHPKLASAAGLGDEDQSLPGFTEDGRKAAKASLLASKEPRQTLDAWLGHLHSRPPLLHPNLERIGLGAARSARGAWITVLDTTRGHGAEPVAFPAPGQTDIPLSFSGGPEVATPAAGFPVSLQFPVGKLPTAVVAFLTDERGNRIPVWLSTPEQPLPGVKRPELVGMIPKNMLSPKSIYRVHVSGKIDERRFEKEWEFSTEDDGDEAGIWATKMVDRINQFRQQAGLAEVELDDDLSQACRSHAKYLVINARRPELQGLGVHEEDAALPGFTPQGKKAAAKSDIAIGDHEPMNALNGWMATLYHRVPILEPGLKKVGFGCARGERQGWVTVLDIKSGAETSLRTRPILWPVDGQTDVPLNFPPGGETPNPIPEDKTGQAGYPITVFFPKKSVMRTGEARLEFADGRRVPCWFSTPGSPANPKYAANQEETVCLIPKEPLQPEQTYRVTMKGEAGTTIFQKSWTFTTGKVGAAAGDAVKAAIERLNLARLSAGVPKVSLDAELSKGCQAHADYLVQNSKLRGTKGFSAIDEDPALPGYTAAGQRSARRAEVFSLAPNSTTQIDDLLGTLFRRSFVLDPRLRRIGVGCALEPNQGWVNVLDLKSGFGDGDPVIYPAVGQEKVPLQGSDRIPDDLKSPAGYPITIWFPGRPVIRNVRATLAESNDTAVDIWLSQPTAPFDISVQQPNLIGIHPRRPLRPGRTYSFAVTADVDGVPARYSGRFSTADE